MRDTPLGSGLARKNELALGKTRGGVEGSSLGPFLGCFPATVIKPACPTLVASI